jgi:membrane protease YdiL (CAAX protease family)
MFGFALIAFAMSTTIAIVWTAIIVLAAPIAGLVARRPLAARQKPRALIYVASAANLIVIGAITGVIDIYRDSKTISAIGWTMPLSQLVAWSLGLTVVSVLISFGVFVLRRNLNRPPSAIVMSLLPETMREQAMFVLLCLLVGLVEEFLFRGFAFFTIRGLASPLIAGSIVTISFALQHGIQDAIGIVRAFVLGVLLIVPVVMTGSLLPSIVAHAIVDAFSGLYGRTAMAGFQPSADRNST